MNSVSKPKSWKKYFKTFVSMRFFSLFLIFFGLSGTIAWPMTGLYFTAGVNQAESTLELVIVELRNIERTLNESYSQLESLQKSTTDFNNRMNNMLEALNKSSLSLLALSTDIKKTSILLNQASESSVLRWISEDFSEAIKDAAEDLENFSEAFENQNISLNEFLMEFNTIETMVQIGNQLINFLKNSFKSFLTILKFIAFRLESVTHILRNFKYGLIILTLDVTLIHLSLAIIGFAFRRKRFT